MAGGGQVGGGGGGGGGGRGYGGVGRGITNSIVINPTSTLTHHPNQKSGKS